MCPYLFCSVIFTVPVYGDWVCRFLTGPSPHCHHLHTPVSGSCQTSETGADLGQKKITSYQGIWIYCMSDFKYCVCINQMKNVCLLHIQTVLTWLPHPRCGPPFTRSKTWAGLSNCLKRRRNFTPWLSPLLELTKTRRGLAHEGGQVAFQKPMAEWLYLVGTEILQN